MTRTRIFFGAAVFLASFLLFLVEPIVARQLLPLLGGSAAVWITCLVFFQTALLCAYLYAHWLTQTPQSRSSIRSGRPDFHLFLLLLATASLSFFWTLGNQASSGGLDHPFLA